MNTCRQIVKIAVLGLICTQAASMQAGLWGAWSFTEHMLYNRVFTACICLFKGPHSLYKARTTRQNAKNKQKIAGTIFAEKKDVMAYQKDCELAYELKQKSRNLVTSGLGDLARVCLNLVPFYVLSGKAPISPTYITNVTVLTTLCDKLIEFKGHLSGAIIDTTIETADSGFGALCHMGPTWRGVSSIVVLGIAAVMQSESFNKKTLNLPAKTFAHNQTPMAGNNGTNINKIDKQ